jgi:hypothetical protein
MVGLQDQIIGLETEKISAEEEVFSLKKMLEVSKRQAEELRCSHARAIENLKRVESENSALSKNHQALRSKYDLVSQQLSEESASSDKKLDKIERKYANLQADYEDLTQALHIQRDASQHWQDMARKLEFELRDSSQLRLESADKAGEQELPETASKAVHGQEIEIHEQNDQLDNADGKSSALETRAHDLIETKVELAHWKDQAMLWKNLASSLEEEHDASVDKDDIFNRADRHADHCNWTEHEESFLRRLSQQLGCSGKTSNDLLPQLTERVKKLVADRIKFKEGSEELQSQILKQERDMQMIRSEMSSEISALKAELASAETECIRAQDERNRAEQRLIEISKYDDDLDSTFENSSCRLSQEGSFAGARRRSTLSDFFHSANVHGPVRHEDLALENCSARCSLPDQKSRPVDLENGAYGIDPSIMEAVQSLSALIRNKDMLLERNKVLKEKLMLAIRSGAAGLAENAASVRALAIDSNSSNAELSKIISIQDGLIHQLLMSKAEAEAQAEHNNTENDPPANDDPTVTTCASPGGGSIARSEILVSKSESTRRTSRSSKTSLPQRLSFHHTVEYLQAQLREMRSLCDDRFNTIAHLQETIRQMEGENEITVKAQNSSDVCLAELKDSHQQWSTRVASMVGLEPSFDAIEKYVCETAVATRVRREAHERLENRFELAQARLGSALAQKRILSFVIHIYQSKYQLDIFAASKDRPSAIVRFRRVIAAVLACVRVRRLAAERPVLFNGSEWEMQVNITRTYHLPAAVNLMRRGEFCVELTSAVVALSAVSKLEGALSDRDRDIQQLRSSIVALESNDAYRRETTSAHHLCDKGNGADGFDHSEDLIARKNELARRLKKLQRQKDEMSMQLSKEREARLSAETRIHKFANKILSYQKRLSKATRDMESLDRSYKFAIQSLTRQMDLATLPKRSDRNSIDTVVLLAQADSKFGTPRGLEPALPRSLSPDAQANVDRKAEHDQRHDMSMLDDLIMKGHAQLGQMGCNDPKYAEVETYIKGLNEARKHNRRTSAAAAVSDPSAGRPRQSPGESSGKSVRMR